MDRLKLSIAVLLVCVIITVNCFDKPKCQPPPFEQGDLVSPGNFEPVAEVFESKCIGSDRYVRIITADFRFVLFTNEEINILKKPQKLNK